MSKKKYRIYTITGVEITKWGRDFVAESPEKARAKAMKAVETEGWEFWDEYESSTEFEAVQSEPLTFDKFLLIYRKIQAMKLYKYSYHNSHGSDDWAGKDIMLNIINLERAYPEYYSAIRGSARINVKCWDLIAEKKDQQQPYTEQELRDQNII